MLNINLLISTSAIIGYVALGIIALVLIIVIIKSIIIVPQANTVIVERLGK